MYKLTTLKNGLKVITCEMPNVSGVSTNIFVGAGSRYETKEENGISHFLEHMVFKGTKKRPSALDLSKVIDSIGGMINAATSHDYTFYWTKVPKKYFSLGIEVLSDMLLNSLLKEEEINKEKGVIIEEINMKNDTPMSNVLSLGYQLMWGNTPLGQDILGPKENIVKMNKENFVNYLKNLYQPQNMAIAIAGNIKHQIIVKEVEKYLGGLKNNPIRAYQKYEDKQSKPEILLHYKKTDQAHLFLGFKAIPRHHPQKPVLDIINMILSGGMSSRLFINIREKRGLAYYIRAYEDNFLDTGCFFAHAGLNSERLEEAIKAILEEFKKLKEEKVSAAELKKVKEYIKGNLLLDMDDSEEVSSWFGTQAIFDKEIKTPQEKISEIEKVTPEQVQKLAKQLFTKDKLNLTLIGPFKDKNLFLKLLEI